MTTPFSGVYPAMTTPFREDESIAHDRLAADARRLEAAGVDGLVPVGSTGESATLTHDEHAQVVETVVDAVDDVPVIAGAGSNATHEAVSLAEDAEAAGADAVLLISPYYNKPEAAGYLEHYRTIADAVDLPGIVYNVPSRTGRNVPVDVVAELAEHQNIRGYKAASGDLGRVSEVIERTSDQQFSVLSGDDGLTLPICSLGGTGTISVVANVEPERTGAMIGAVAEDDMGRARDLHYELAPLIRELFVETNPIPVKEAMAIREDHPPHVRSPLTRLSAERRDELREALDDLADEPTPEVTA
ncbi:MULTISPECIES: 4-hydroxy-tetrahydrodipicolinate synthase [Halolamina]|uniref:4-hydroxy-tetrahydrodipicolinate synthase n=1 Tax=Halolamina pelagica TaxID=699431 RepID=A0A1I5NJF4_9EURY|nr:MULTISPECIES: 4-hydroxy-tetrahydrodipicolinate synthase [Halolamina]NHX36343.1 4-hydroxy-tetrahydrodipicolinate synthase [Halolamina sp. R1-12]SFP21857.1 4-hydroxy-tetrahydrodipicolinate synthase [Halolamina pelagica]